MAVLLTVGFYLLALATVAILLAAVWLDLRSGEVNVRFILVCLFVAGIVIYSIIPRRMPFRAPGPRLDAAAQPRLLGYIEDIARRVGEGMPREVYLDSDANAAVLEAGGLLGIGRRRVMVVGLPLLQGLTESQLRGVIAHEFGHYTGGDTRLAPWIYRTRLTLLNTVRRLRRYWYAWFLTLPFVWYAKLFLRTTQAISRQQEFAADRLAAKLVGAQTMAATLQAVEAVAFAYGGFWRTEFVPALQNGYQPPLAEGFLRYLHQPRTRGLIADQAAAAGGRPSDPYDSHPSLAERLEALSALPAGPDASGEPAAITLLDQEPNLEAMLIRMLMRPGAPAPQPVSWDDVPQRVFLPGARQRAQRFGHLLAGARLYDLPAVVPHAAAIGRAAATSENPAAVVGDAQAHYLGLSIISSAAYSALEGAGWRFRAEPGGPMVATRNGDTLDVDTAISDLAAGKLTAEAWTEQVNRLGLADLLLAPVREATPISA